MSRTVLHHRRFIGHLRIVDYSCIIDAIAGLVVRVLGIVLTSECLNILGTKVRPKALLTIIARQEAIHVAGIVRVPS